MKIIIVNKSRHNLPEYVTEQSAGMDIRANIDDDYRGEVCIILINLSGETFVIKEGERISQMIIAKHERAEWIAIE